MSGIGNSSIETSARLGIMEQAGTAVRILVEGLDRDELLRSRLTRAEVLRQLRELASSAAGMAPDTQRAMPEIDWAGWQSMETQLAQPPGVQLDEALWFACESLVPATLLWLQLYRKSAEALFQMRL